MPLYRIRFEVDVAETTPRFALAWIDAFRKNHTGAFPTGSRASVLELQGPEQPCSYFHRICEPPAVPASLVVRLLHAWRVLLGDLVALPPAEAGRRYSPMFDAWIKDD